MKKILLALALVILTSSSAVAEDVNWTATSINNLMTGWIEGLQKCLGVYGKSTDSYATNEEFLKFIQSECNSDQDSDGVVDYLDNCPLVANKEQNPGACPITKALCLSENRDAVTIEATKRKINDMSAEFGFYVYIPEDASIETPLASVISDDEKTSKTQKLTVTCEKFAKSEQAGAAMASSLWGDAGDNSVDPAYACTIKGKLAGTEDLWISLNYKYAKNSVCTVAFGNGNDVSLSTAKVITEGGGSTGGGDGSGGRACGLTASSGSSAGWLLDIFLLGLPAVLASFGRRGKK